MFESTLEAQGLNDGERRIGSLSAAALAHAGVGIVIVAVTAIIIPPVHVPEPDRLVVPIVRGLPDDVARPSAQKPRNKGNDASTPNHTIAPPPVPPAQPPEVTPIDLPKPASDPAPSDSTTLTEGPIGDPDGKGNGLPDGKGHGDGEGDGESGIGGPAEAVYVTGDMVRPVLLTKVEPAYPEVPRRANMGGRVTVQAVIGLDGNVESAEVFASTNSLFNQAALDAVRKWRYRPATMNGKPVRVFFSVQVDFLMR